MKQSVTTLYLMAQATSAPYGDFFADEHGNGESYDDDENYSIDYYEKDQDLNAPAAAAAADVAAALAVDGDNIIVATTAAATAAADNIVGDDDDDDEEEDEEEEEEKDTDADIDT